MKNLGFMQGRLSPIVENRIQSFPWLNWQQEFSEAQKIGFQLMEWTIDGHDYESNPVFKNVSEIKERKKRNQISIPSITNDHFMETPPWKTNRGQCRDNLKKLIEAMKTLDMKILVIPLVDNSSIKSDPGKSEIVKNLFLELEQELKSNDVQIAFETDLDPKRNEAFIQDFPDSVFGINYDIGNSASLGYRPQEEIKLYGNRIINVHVKDRHLGGTTVALGEGSADFVSCFEALQKSDYLGNYILQTARAKDGRHGITLKKAKEFVEHFFDEENKNGR